LRSPFIMPPQFLYDISGIDLNQVVFDQEEIRRCNLQRGDMEQLNGIAYAAPELGRIIGYKDARSDEFWVPGHIPGNPLLPGVLMIEAGAQLASFYVRKYENWQGFIGFGGAEEIRFRQSVRPGQRLYLLGQKLWQRHHRFCSKIQGVVDGSLVFECTITGVEM
jgi:3-hydroxyacyl-[acyl-carrier-protein] dehydratase